ncbi:type I secretion system permease/ATPase [Ideonella sp. DXS22W]|uniref:Type I secretion system permease/ATPase n=1 Tax=Pseudaquabacterium inlustre TaxID=2984192 RepID=A0ABU9CAW8_9BURK
MSQRHIPPFDAAPEPVPAGVDEPGPAGLAEDALAHALLWLTQHHGQERSIASLLHGQELNGALGPDQAVRALREAGFNAGLVQREIADIAPVLLPAVLLLRSGDACVLVARTPLADGGQLCDLVMPGPEHQSLQATLDELRAEYAGVALVATPKPVETRASAQAAPEIREAMRDPGSHWLWGTLRRFSPYYRGAMLAALLSNTLMLATGTLTSVIYDKVIPHQAFATLWALAIGGGLALIFDLSARQLRGYLIDLAGKKADLLVGTQLFRQSLAVRMEHRPESAGAYSHIVGQIELVREFCSSATMSAASDLPFIAIFIGMTFVMAGPLGVVPLLAVPIILIGLVVVQGTMRRASTAHMQQQADLHGLLVEAVEGIEDIKATGAQGRFLHRYEHSTAAAVHSQIKSRAITNLSMNVSMLSQQLVTLVMLVWGVYLIESKVITAGALMGGVMFAMRAIAPLTSLVTLANRWQGARAAMIALDRVMSQPTDRVEGQSYIPLRGLRGRIALHDVSFAYPAAPGQQAPGVLKGVNLVFEPGERVAILGRIGSGKSTILRLVAGLYRPGEGMVDVDGVDLRQIDPNDFRAAVGYVPQDSRLFNGTLRDNVLLGRASADLGRLGAVARLTGLQRVVDSHPLGWDMPVGESGSLLSGGQRQLVALTRSLITRPKVLLMDEPTSSMDAQSELVFLRQLNEAAQGCTLVMVTHRPAVLELVQRIIVVDAGRVVMDGPKAAVLAALSGAKPAAQAAPGQGAGAPPANVHRHPSTQPAERRAAV